MFQIFIALSSFLIVLTIGETMHLVTGLPIEDFCRWFTIAMIIYLLIKMDQKEDDQS